MKIALHTVFYCLMFLPFLNSTLKAEDLNKAVMKIRKSAEELGIDPERIAVGGHSAEGISGPIKL